MNKANIGCRIGASRAAIFLYAYDIILLAPSVQALQFLVNIWNSELSFLDMAINPKKSACTRFGPKYRNVCANAVASRSVINWTTSCRYLGVCLESSIKFKCSFGKNKARFYQAFNNIFGKIVRNASEEVLFSLFASFVIHTALKCVQ